MNPKASECLYICVFCRKNLQSKEKLTEHLKEKLKCGLPQAGLQRKEKEDWVLSFVKLMHQKLLENNKKKQVYAGCPLCEVLVKASSTRLKIKQLPGSYGIKIEHINRHLNYRPYVCNKCDQTRVEGIFRAPTKFLIEKHMKETHQIKKEKYEPHTRRVIIRELEDLIDDFIRRTGDPVDDFPIENDPAAAFPPQAPTSVSSTMSPIPAASSPSSSESSVASFMKSVENKRPPVKASGTPLSSSSSKAQGHPLASSILLFPTAQAGEMTTTSPVVPLSHAKVPQASEGSPASDQTTAKIEQKLYRCVLCDDLHFTDEAKAFAHYGDHLGYLRCTDCKKTFKSPKAFISHDSKKTNSKAELEEHQRMKCWISDFLEFQQQQTFKNLYSIHMEGFCTVCDQMDGVHFRSAASSTEADDVDLDALEDHIYKHYNCFRFECILCDFDTQPTKSPESEAALKPFRCSSLKQEARRHLNRKHGFSYEAFGPPDDLKLYFKGLPLCSQLQRLISLLLDVSVAKKKLKKVFRVNMRPSSDPELEELEPLPKRAKVEIYEISDDEH